MGNPKPYKITLLVMAQTLALEVHRSMHSKHKNSLCDPNRKDFPLKSGPMELSEFRYCSIRNVAARQCTKLILPSFNLID